jgi:hypothetical protein
MSSRNAAQWRGDSTAPLLEVQPAQVRPISPVIATHHSTSSPTRRS